MRAIIGHNAAFTLCALQSYCYLISWSMATRAWLCLFTLDDVTLNSCHSLETFSRKSRTHSFQQSQRLRVPSSPALIGSHSCPETILNSVQIDVSSICRWFDHFTARTRIWSVCQPMTALEFGNGWGMTIVSSKRCLRPYEILIIT